MASKNKSDARVGIPADFRIAAVDDLHNSLRNALGASQIVLDGAAVDRVDPRCAGIGYDDPGSAKHRQAADDAKPGVHRVPGERRTAGDRDRHCDIGPRLAARRAVRREAVHRRVLGARGEPAADRAGRGARRLRALACGVR